MKLEQLKQYFDYDEHMERWYVQTDRMVIIDNEYEGGGKIEWIEDGEEYFTCGEGYWEVGIPVDEDLDVDVYALTKIA